MRSVLFIPTVPWEGDCFQTPHHMARQFARNGWRVYYGNRGPRRTYELEEIEKNLFLIGNFARFCQKLRCEGGVDLKVFGNPKGLRRHRAFSRVPGKSLWCLWDSMPSWIRMEAIARRSSDLMVGVSESLRASRPQSWNMHLMPNGVEAEKVGASYPCPVAFKGLEKPIVSFIGYAQGEWVDQRLLMAVAREFQLVMIGPAERVPHGTIHIPILEHDKLGPYYQHSACTIVPFSACETARMCSPIKMFESLAAGTPVVASNVTQAEEMAAGTVYPVNSSRSAFLAAIYLAIAERSPATCVDAARDHTWEARFTGLLPLIEEILD